MGVNSKKTGIFEDRGEDYRLSLNLKL